MRSVLPQGVEDNTLDPKTLDPGDYFEYRVYIGERDGNNLGQIVHAWVTLDDNGEIDEHNYNFWDEPPFPPPNYAGAIYRFVRGENDRLFIRGEKGPAYVGAWPDKEDRDRWAIKDKAYYVQRVSHEAMVKDAKRVDSVKAHIRLLKKEMKGLSFDERTSAVAYLLQELL